jgi:anti-sigma factor RsiW
MTGSGGAVPSRTHEEIQELLGAYALDALEPDEAAEVEAHLSDCPRCAAEVDAHRDVAGLLGNGGEEAPAALWDRIAEQLPARRGGSVTAEAPGWEALAGRLDRPGGGDSAPTGSPSPVAGGPASTGTVVPLGRRPGHGWVRMATAVAAVAAVLAAVLGVQVARLDHRVGQLQADAARPALSRAVAAALEDPTSQRVRLVPPTGSAAPAAEVTLVLTGSGTGYLVAQGLDPLGPGRTYQLWAVLPAGAVSLGLLGPHPTEAAFGVDPGVPVPTFAVTAERAGGAVAPTSRPVVEGSVGA